MTEEKTTYAGWAVLELMGHVKIAGFVTEVQLAGFGVLHVAIPNDQGSAWEQHIPPASLYRMTTVAEDVARRVAAHALNHGNGLPVDEWTVRTEIREQIEKEERATLEKSVRRQVEAEHTKAMREERERVLTVLSDAKAFAQQAATGLSNETESEQAWAVARSIDVYCEESYRRTGGRRVYPDPAQIHSDDDPYDADPDDRSWP